MSVVVLWLGTEKAKESKDNASRLLSKLFDTDTDMDYNSKTEMLEKEFHISTTKDIDKEVQNMCNLSTGLLNRGKAKGKAEGDLNRAKRIAFNLHVHIAL